MCYQMISYLLAVLFISLASSPAVQAAFREATGSSDDKNILFSIACIAVFSIFYFVLCQSCTCRPDPEQDEKVNKEPFYFEVTPNRTLLRNIPEYAVYKGGPGVGFSFNAVGSGICSPDECRTEGLIKGCPNSTVYGEGDPDNYM